MTCPKCGLQTLPEQKFCRSCGTSLQMTTQPLAAPIIAELENRPGQRGNERANRTVLWGFIVMLVGVAIGVIGKKLMHEDLVTVIGVLISLAGMFLTVYPYLSPSGRGKSEPSRSSQTPVITESQPPKALPHERQTEYVPSITERTTDLLKDPVTPAREPNTAGEANTPGPVDHVS